jgi:hypothetical protein
MSASGSMSSSSETALAFISSRVIPSRRTQATVDESVFRPLEVIASNAGADDEDDVTDDEATVSLSIAPRSTGTAPAGRQCSSSTDCVGSASQSSSAGRSSGSIPFIPSSSGSRQPAPPASSTLGSSIEDDDRVVVSSGDLPPAPPSSASSAVTTTAASSSWLCAGSSRAGLGLFLLGRAFSAALSSPSWSGS